MIVHKRLQRMGGIVVIFTVVRHFVYKSLTKLEPSKKTIIMPAQPIPSAGGNKKKEPVLVTGILLNFNQERRGGMALELLLVMEKKEGKSYQRIPLTGSHYKAYLQGLPAPVAAVVRRAADESLLELLVRSGFGWLRDADKPFENLDDRHY